MPITSLAEIAVRTTQVWGGLRTRPYSMGGTVPRNDCSSYVATVLGLANPLAWSTVNLPEVLTPISFDQAMPGDVWGKLGPGTGGANGHVAVITGTPRTRGDTRWEVVEQSGPTGVPGPARNVYKNPPAGYRAYRSKYVATVLPRPATVEDDMAYINVDKDGTWWYVPGHFTNDGQLAIYPFPNWAVASSYRDAGHKVVDMKAHGVTVAIADLPWYDVQPTPWQGEAGGNGPSAEEIAKAVADEIAADPERDGHDS